MLGAGASGVEIASGCSSVSHAPAVSMTRPPNFVPGIGLGTEPQARMIVLASISSPPTVTLPPPASAPSPSITSMPFFLNSPATPPVSVLMTLSRRCATAAKSTCTPPCTLSPNSSASSISALTSATRSTALAGMHASLRQRPPTTPALSTTAVFIPTCAARIAATYPPGPDPITTQSYERSAIGGAP